MSNYLAIATVTTALQQIIQVEVSRDVPGIQVTTTRPGNPASSIAGPSINIFLYQATPNPAWRNADLRTGRPKGELIKHAQAGLDLHYLFTFYGDEKTLEPQHLMGSTIRTLVDCPLLTQSMIENSLVNAKTPILEESDLADQVQKIRFIPSTMTTDELTRIWSILFQTPYALSFPYQATAVLIQGERSGKLALPVRTTEASIMLARPVIENIEHCPLNDDKRMINTITLDSQIIIQGWDFAGKGDAKVQIGRARMTPSSIENDAVSLSFAALSSEERDQLRAGVSGIQLLRISGTAGDGAAEVTVESNAFPFELCPQVIHGGEIRLEILESDSVSQKISGIVIVPLDVVIAPRQRVFLLLNSTSNRTSDSYIFRAERHRRLAREIHFPIQNIQAGEYLLRVQVDGAASPLEVDDRNSYVGPILLIEPVPSP